MYIGTRTITTMTVANMITSFITAVIVAPLNPLVKVNAARIMNAITREISVIVTVSTVVSWPIMTVSTACIP